MNQSDLKQLVDGVIGSENYYLRMIDELGDALQAIASPHEELNNYDIRVKVLGTIAEIRSDMRHILNVISGKENCTEE